MKKKLKSPLIFVLFLGLCVVSMPRAEEGMYPLSELHKLNLKSLGFQLDSLDVYNPNGISLIDGIINLSGCSASFVSADGLILTNYHCAFRAIQSITSKEKDYMKLGFYAKDRTQEALAKGYTVRITESYRDVSQEVLSVVKKKMTYAQRTKAIEKKIKQMVVKVEKKNPGKRADIAEMFKGKTYVLFIYKYIKDVRLVYAPPRSVGEYGGEIDNWMWPRHTGDFAFMRAYTSADGKTAEYSTQNIPYKPKKYLKVAPEGVKTEDFVFILGYPGRTHRHKTSHFIKFEENLRMPFVVDLYTWLIELKEKMSEKGRDAAIKLSGSLNGLWNAKKRYSAQLKGLKNLALANRRRAEEEKLQVFINKDETLKKNYGTVLEDIGKLYQQKSKTNNYQLTFRYLISSCIPLNTAFTIYEASIERKKKDTERESRYMNRNFPRTKRYMMRSLRNYYPPAEKAVLKELMLRAIKVKTDTTFKAITALLKGKEGEKDLDQLIDNWFQNTKVVEAEELDRLFNQTTRQLQAHQDPFIILARSLYPEYKALRETQEEEKGLLDSLSARLIDIKKQFIGKDFIPDANGTLRLTYGKIRGYQPADAVHSLPFTTVTGIMEKQSGKDPFVVPARLAELIENQDYGKFKHPGLGKVPVAMLYNMDTTGGNSGSPVLNARGELIGLNFDRVYEATINDYAWDEKYSRSIGVDIRFILWFLDKFSDSQYLLKEMGVN